VIGDPEGLHGGGMSGLFKIELRGDFSPMDPLGIPDHQISPKGMFGNIRFIRNWFMKIEVVPNIPVYVSVYRNWIISFLKNKKLVSRSYKIKTNFLKTRLLPNRT
jgi:hypothetical protein